MSEKIVQPHSLQGHERSQESIKLLGEHLIKLHKDRDENSLFVRFGELLHRVESMEIDREAIWRGYINTLKKNKELNALLLAIKEPDAPTTSALQDDRQRLRDMMGG
jgi:hypothetical protein